MDRAGLINAGSVSIRENDLKDTVRTAIINKRAVGMGVISGQKSFQKPIKDGFNFCTPYRLFTWINKLTVFRFLILEIHKIHLAKFYESSRKNYSSIF